MKSYRKTGSLRHRLRTQRLRPLLELIEQVHRDKGRVAILDLGGTRAYWNLIPAETLREKGVRVTIVNLAGANAGAVPEEGFEILAGDACSNPRFADGSFDIVHSNSVIEHVGDWGRMIAFAGEVKRLAPHYFVQTPNYWFPIEPHCMTPFIHWLPKPMRVALVRRFKLGSWKRQVETIDAVRVVESARLLTGAMVAALFPEARIERERYGLLTKSFVAVR